MDLIVHKCAVRSPGYRLSPTAILVQFQQLTLFHSGSEGATAMEMFSPQEDYNFEY